MMMKSKESIYLYIIQNSIVIKKKHLTYIQLTNLLFFTYDYFYLFILSS
jgi:hypothetical protein